MTFESLEKNIPEYDLWHYLALCRKNIVMYGMGNGADKIINELDKFNVKVSDFFASDGFVRGQTFHGKTVLSFSQIREKYDDFIILVSFGSEREEVIHLIEELDAEYEVYIPDVPVAGDKVFNLDFYKDNRDYIKFAFEIFADDYSRGVYFDIIMYKLTGKLKYLLASTDSDTAVYNTLFDTSKWKICADIGAYNGDSIRHICKCAPNVKKIIAIEPDTRTFNKLLKNTKELNVEIDAHNLCAWSHKTELVFDSGANRNSSVGGIGHTASVGDTKTKIVGADSLDNIIDDKCVDFIKFDVEGSESEALDGAISIIRTAKPDILMSAYHRSEDIFNLVVKLDKLLPDRKIYLRRKRCLPAWEISICLSNKTILF